MRAISGKPHEAATQIKSRRRRQRPQPDRGSHRPFALNPESHACHLLRGRHSLRHGIPLFLDRHEPERIRTRALRWCRTRCRPAVPVDEVLAGDVLRASSIPASAASRAPVVLASIASSSFISGIAALRWAVPAPPCFRRGSSPGMGLCVPSERHRAGGSRFERQPTQENSVEAGKPVAICKSRHARRLFPLCIVRICELDEPLRLHAHADENAPWDRNCVQQESWIYWTQYNDHGRALDDLSVRGSNAQGGLPVAVLLWGI